MFLQLVKSINSKRLQGGAHRRCNCGRAAMQNRVQKLNAAREPGPGGSCVHCISVSYHDFEPIFDCLMATFCLINGGKRSQKAKALFKRSQPLNNPIDESNNPHLAGGESKYTNTWLPKSFTFDGFRVCVCICTSGAEADLAFLLIGVLFCCCCPFERSTAKATAKPKARSRGQGRSNRCLFVYLSACRTN